jgi:hypothetical protein
MFAKHQHLSSKPNRIFCGPLVPRGESLIHCLSRGFPGLGLDSRVFNISRVIVPFLDSLSSDMVSPEQESACSCSFSKMSRHD